MEEKSKMDEQQLQHVSHEHPLMFEERYDGPPVSCEACEDPVTGPCYSCTKCSNDKFILHKSCAQLPREILQHPLHSKHPLVQTRVSGWGGTKCDACHTNCRSFTYRCYECNFDLDVKCAKNFRNIDCIEHFSHMHLLNLSAENQSEKQPQVFCTGCLEPVLGPRYICKIIYKRRRSCSNFVLHRSCAELPLKLKHPMHYDEHLLTLNFNQTREYHCDVCDQDCSRRFTYNCFQCDFNIDLKCASVEGFKHSSHHHPLMIKKQGGRKRESDPLVICDACQLPIYGLSYSCIHTYRRHKCGFNLHKSCAELPCEIVQHPLHRQHPLVLLSTVQNIKVGCFCNACNQPCRYRYSCSICSFNLDLKCASNWRNIIENDSHQHQFIVPRREMGKLYCDICGEFWSGTMKRSVLLFQPLMLHCLISSKCSSCCLQNKPAAISVSFLLKSAD